MFAYSLAVDASLPSDRRHRQTLSMQTRIMIVVSGKLTRSGVGSAGACIADRRFTDCELLCLRLALELETSIVSGA